MPPVSSKLKSSSSLTGGQTRIGPGQSLTIHVTYPLHTAGLSKKGLRQLLAKTVFHLRLLFHTQKKGHMQLLLFAPFSNHVPQETSTTSYS